MLLAVVVMVVGVVGCQGGTFQMRSCPRVTAMKQLDFDKFLGEWYVIQRFNPLATCIKLVIEKSPEGVYSVNETGQPLGFPIPYYSIIMKPRKIQFLRNDTNSIFRVEKNFAHMTLSTFGVVTTDYDSHALVWGCDPVLFGSVQNVDVLSRTPSPDADVLQPAKDALDDMKVEHSALGNVTQSHCAGKNSETPGEDARGTNNIVTV